MSETADLLRLSVAERGQLATVTVAGELDLGTAELLAEELRLTQANGCAGVVVDLREVSFMDVEGVAPLYDARTRARAGGHTLTLVTGRATARLFDLLELWRDFDTIVGVPEAEAGRT
jgi:anti-sigma B factor antagonist